MSKLHSDAAFADFLGPELVSGLRAVEIYAPNAIQANAIPLALSGRDLIVCAQTGSGKTLTFLLPILHQLTSGRSSQRGNHALILAPTEQLSLQVVALASKLVASLSSPVELRCMDDSIQTRSSASAPQLWVGTPKWLSENLSFDLKNVAMMAIDEADLLLCVPSAIAGGEDLLREQREKTEELLTAAVGAQLFLAMAHLSNEREEELQKRFPEAQMVGHTGVMVPTLRQCFHYFKGDKDAKLFWVLSEAEKEDTEPSAGSTMIFCSLPSTADRLQGALAERKPNSRPFALHENTPAQDKARIASEFRQGGCEILLTTDMAARGLDFPRVRHVVLFDAPVDATAFVHSAGRTARRGSTGLVTCIIEGGDAAREHIDGKIFHALRDGPQLTFAKNGGQVAVEPQPSHPGQKEPKGRRQRGYAKSAQ
ncbi:RRP3, partial [Symbiodinium sp. CCMP2592]